MNPDYFPWTSLNFDPEQFADAFPLIASIFEQYKIEVVHAESHLWPSDSASKYGDRLNVHVWTITDDRKNAMLKTYLRSKRIGDWKDNELRKLPDGRVICLTKWIMGISNGGNRNVTE